MKVALSHGASWREGLLEVVLRVAVLLGAVVYVFSVYKAVEEGLWPIVVVDTVVMAAVVVLWRWRGLPLHWRAGVLCAVFYLLGATLITVAAGVGQIYLLGQSVLATVLLGLRFGLATVVVNALTPLVVGAGIGGGWIITPAGFDASVGDWALIALNFLLIDLVLVLMVGAVLQTVEQALQREIDARTALARERGLLQARERHLQTLIDATPDGVFVIDANGEIAEVNRAGLELLGATREEEVLGQPVVSYLAEADRPRFEAAHGAVLAGTSRTLSCQLQGRDEAARTVELACAPLQAAGSATRHLALVRDITVRLRLEEHLRQPQRLDALGKLTGGIAHDFNNLLTVVLGHAETLAHRLADRRELQAQADTVRVAAERGADLIRRLLAFAGRQALAPAATDVSGLLAGMEPMLRRTLGAQVVLTIDAPASLEPALVDPAQLESAVLNLCINARDAMPDGGRLDIGLARVVADAALTAALPDLDAQAYLVLSVADTGHGMSAQVRAKAVEPFFTTKGVGRGTGLGLSMVYGFVRQSGGTLEIQSEPGRGTRMRLFLPVAAETPVTMAPPTESDIAPTGSECVLVVEDEDMVRHHVVSQLQALGYRVHAFHSGPQALAWLREHEDADLLFTDVVLPSGMNGRQLARAAVALRPGLRVLFTSGYAQGPDAAAGGDVPAAPWLLKPYRRAALARRVREALDGPAPQA